MLRSPASRDTRAAMSLAPQLLAAADALSQAVSGLKFGGSITHVYNPLAYARAPYAAYLERYAQRPKRIVFLGMNPGPFGMAQTGIPFGEVSFVRDWLGVEAPVARPAQEHPKRPVQGFGCSRSEVSGARLWGMFQSLCQTPERFFAWGFVANYCPLVFMDEGGRNVTPDKLAQRERAALFAACDAHLRALSAALAPEWLVAIGKFAEARAVEAALSGVRIASMPHPSPANPGANRDWDKSALARLASQGLRLPPA